MAEPTSENPANATENASNAGEPPRADQEDTEDWDKTREGNEPQNPLYCIIDASGKGAACQSLGRSGGRNLAQLMKLPEEEEKNVEAELDKWVCP